MNTFALYMKESFCKFNGINVSECYFYKENVRVNFLKEGLLTVFLTFNSEENAKESFDNLRLLKSDINEIELVTDNLSMFWVKNFNNAILVGNEICIYINLI